MMDMIERVARALHHCDEPGELTDAPEAQKRYCYTAARAAIGAMREPTEAMVRASYGNNVPPPYTMERTIAELAMNKAAMTWQAMIDAALKPSASKP